MNWSVALVNVEDDDIEQYDADEEESDKENNKKSNLIRMILKINL